jgi:hypothetical protein
VKKGTSAKDVVNVKLLAVKPKRSSLKRCRRVIAVSRQGNFERSARSCCKFMPVSCHQHE